MRMSHRQPLLHPFEDVKRGDISIDTTAIMPTLAALLETALEHSQNRCYPPPVGLRLCCLRGALFSLRWDQGWSLCHLDGTPQDGC